MMNIVLMGFDFVCPNKGCEALSYSVISLIKDLFPEEKIIIHNVSCEISLGKMPTVYPDIKFYNHKIFLKSPKYIYEICKLCNTADAVLDITYGDSFSDLYGKRWLTRTNLDKQLALISKGNFILMPQTYGPYNSLWLRLWSLHIIKKCNHVFSRDYKSVLYLKKWGINNINVVTDLAMALPYDKDRYKIDDSKVNIGVNVSSLLWDEAYDKGNRFGLTVDYRKYCKDLIQKLSSEKNFRIHLIPHVIDESENPKENDLTPIRELHELYPKTIIPPNFNTPIDIKSYISNMDVFIGARMHATIGAFSAGVPVIPFAYSRKFDGLFGNLNYDYVVDGQKLSTEDALSKTIEYICRRDQLKNDETIAMKKVDLLLNTFRNNLKELICGGTN